MTPKSPSAMAILSVVRRDHLRPVMGSPAVSYSSRNSISVRMSVFFFRLVCVRLQRGKQAALLFIEQAVEKQNGRFEFIGRYLERGSIGHQRNRLRGLSGAQLIPGLDR